MLLHFIRNYKLKLSKRFETRCHLRHVVTPCFFEPPFHHALCQIQGNDLMIKYF